jgi:hypothetical protein
LKSALADFRFNASTAERSDLMSAGKQNHACPGGLRRASPRGNDGAQGDSFTGGRAALDFLKPFVHGQMNLIRLAA